MFTLQSVRDLQGEMKSFILNLEQKKNKDLADHLCLNNLNGKMNQLNDIRSTLSVQKHNLVFIGQVGVGKTTAISHLFDLLGNFKKGGGVERKTILATSSGRTTISEVQIKSNAEHTIIEVEPYSEQEMWCCIDDFCSNFCIENAEDRIPISKEIETAIRNMTKLKINHKENKDQAIDILQNNNGDKNALFAYAWQQLNMENRTGKVEHFTGNAMDEAAWLKDTFEEINFGLNERYAIPKKIIIHLSRDYCNPNTRGLINDFSDIIDTKGLDENPLREDLENYINDDKNICIFVTAFNAAPDPSIVKLLEYHIAANSKNQHRFVILGVPRPQEAEKVQGANDEREIGLVIKKRDIMTALKNAKITFDENNIVFFEAMRCYNKKLKLEEEFTQEDVEGDRRAVLETFQNIINQKQKIQAEKYAKIREEFKQIMEEKIDFLEDYRIELSKLVDNLKVYKDLAVQEFVYEDWNNNFAIQFRNYYDNNYRAWNTKHAVHRNRGNYKGNHVAYDAQVVASGVDLDGNKVTMASKLTKERRLQVLTVLENAKNFFANKNAIIAMFIENTIVKFKEMYENYIQNLAKTMKDHASEKFTDNFWKSLESERGNKNRQKGETYTSNVLYLFQNRLENAQSNELFKKCLNDYWNQMISSVIRNFEAQ